ncbi:ATP-binding protein [Paenibacillus sp.]|uniref:ATP-binding protein n=1 Tax=Paenibacillus sp. TaxID=58172 RepID=UPI002D391F5A|nr:ATP-binding protein [Paenibacillus sp.]HZG58579.1 ATP-binding protein [Paenibacillus sp.]
MKPAGIAFAIAAVVAIAIDGWMSEALTGHPLQVWIWASNAAIFLALGLQIRKLRRDKRSAERGMMRFTREAVSLYSLQGLQTDMNEAQERLTGYARHEAHGATYLLWFPTDMRATAQAAFALAVEGRPQHFDAVCVRKDGARVDVEVSYVPVLSGSRIVGVYGILKDISETKRNQELLQQSDKLAVVGELAAGIAHEIRNPLTSLRGFVQLAHEQKPSAYTEIMLSELDRIHVIASELLLLGKPQALDVTDKNVATLLESILTLVNTQAILHNVEIAFEREPDTEGIAVRCEETKMKQVFLNVLKNAVEAMPNGGVVTIRLERTGGDVHIRISDQGIGIPREELTRLGQAFYTTKENGTGLGLMISYNIIEQHGGRMTIESEESVGTTVDIRLPIAD